METSALCSYFGFHNTKPPWRTLCDTTKLLHTPLDKSPSLPARTCSIAGQRGRLKKIQKKEEEVNKLSVKGNADWGDERL